MNLALPQPRPGLLGIRDRIVGPGMPADELRIVILAGFVGTVFAAWRVDARLGFGWAVALAALVGFDIVGGAVCNAAQTTKRWYAQSHNTSRAKFGFVLPHMGYVAPVAWLWRGTTSFDTAYFAAFSLALITGSLAMLATPARLAALVAFGVFPNCL